MTTRIMTWPLLRHQPFKTIYLAYVAATLMFKLPWWFFIFQIPALRPRASWTVRRSVDVRFRQVKTAALFDTASFAYDREDMAPFLKNPEKWGLVWVEARPDLIVGEIEELARKNKVTAEEVPGFWYGKRDASGKVGQRAGPDEKVMYAFHPGGYVMGNSKPNSGSAPMYKDLLRELPQFSRLFAIEYRLSQGPPLPMENPFPAAIIDAVMGYNYLVNELGFQPRNILVLGDSAGGTLAVQLAGYLVKSGLDATLPPLSGLLLLAPTMDWGETHTHSQSTMLNNMDTDWIEGYNLTGYCTRAMLGYLPFSVAQENWYFSPGSLALPERKGTYKGFPPSLFLVGTAEMSLDAMRTARRRMEEDIGEEKVTWVEIEDATHIMLALPYHEKELKEAYQAVKKWANSLY